MDGRPTARKYVPQAYIGIEQKPAGTTSIAATRHSSPSAGSPRPSRRPPPRVVDYKSDYDEDYSHNDRRPKPTLRRQNTFSLPSTTANRRPVSAGYYDSGEGRLEERGGGSNGRRPLSGPTTGQSGHVNCFRRREETYTPPPSRKFYRNH